MAFVLEHPSSNLKHFCKICKKGFGCGRALGGHMRAHGIGDENGHIDDEDPASDWDDKQLGGSVNPPSNKRMYALRTNPNRLKTCRVCENCGKEFLSWKSFLEHGKCSSEDAESLVSSPGSEGDNDGTGSRSRGCSAWSKRKRSFRAKVENLISLNCPSSEEEDLANCLMMLSNAGVDPMVAEPEESCASASKEDQERRDPMNLMAPLSLKVPVDHHHMNSKNKGVAKGLFECKACKKVFNSHQALGGHRASHKKVKGCFASRIDNGLHLDDSHEADDDVITHEEILPTQSNSTLQFDQVSNPPLMAASTSKRKSKVHECSICHRIFSSGQALGGHKRCHWITSNAPETSTTLPKFQQQQDQMDQQQIINPKPKLDDDDSALLDLKLDLNLPAVPVNDHHRDRLSGSRRDLQTRKPQGIEVSTEIYLQSWIGTAKEKEDNQQHKHHNLHHRQNADNDFDNIDNNNNNIHDIISNGSVLLPNVDDEADSKVKLAKLSELKDKNTSGGSSPWLQVGIGSTTDVAADP